MLHYTSVDSQKIDTLWCKGGFRNWDIMPLVTTAGDLISGIPPRHHSWRWWLTGLSGHSSKCLQLALAVTIVAPHIGLPEALTNTTLVLKSASLATTLLGDNACIAMASLVGASLVGEYTMRILRTWIGPLLTAQRKAGIEIGRSEERKRHKAESANVMEAQQASGARLNRTIPPPVNDVQPLAE